MEGIAFLQTGERVIALVLALATAALVGLGVIGAQLLLTIASAVTCIAGFMLVSAASTCCGDGRGRAPTT